MTADDEDSLKGIDLEDGRPAQPHHDYATLVDRLCGKYVIPVNDGCGLLDGKDTFTREFPSSPINREAAARIRKLEAALLAIGQIVDDRHAVIRVNLDDIRGHIAQALNPI